jgi:hypothetical protein
MALCSNTAVELPIAARQLRIARLFVNRAFHLGGKTPRMMASAVIYSSAQITQRTSSYGGLHRRVCSHEIRVVLSIKGTTLPLQGPTSKKDQYNDNLSVSVRAYGLSY